MSCLSLGMHASWCHLGPGFAVIAQHKVPCSSLCKYLENIMVTGPNMPGQSLIRPLSWVPELCFNEEQNPSGGALIDSAPSFLISSCPPQYWQTKSHTEGSFLNLCRRSLFSVSICVLEAGQHVSDWEEKALTTLLPKERSVIGR